MPMSIKQRNQLRDYYSGLAPPKKEKARYRCCSWFSYFFK